MATRGPAGGGRRPRVLSSGAPHPSPSPSRGWGLRCDILKPIAERLEDVPLADLVRAIEVGRRAGDAPGAMKPAGGESALLSPALEGSPRSRLECRQLPQAGRPEQRVEAGPSGDLPGAWGHHALAPPRGRGWVAATSVNRAG